MEKKFTVFGCYKESSMLKGVSMLNVKLTNGSMEINAITADVSYIRTLDFISRIPIIGSISKGATEGIRNKIITAFMGSDLICLSDQQDLSPLRLWAKNDNWFGVGKRVTANTRSTPLFNEKVTCSEATRELENMDSILVKDLSCDLFGYEELDEVNISEVRCTLALILYLNKNLGYPLENVIETIREYYSNEDGVVPIYDKPSLVR